MKAIFQTASLCLALLQSTVNGLGTAKPVDTPSPRINIKYGPFKIPAAGKAKGSGMGMPTQMNVKIPCTDCLYTYLKGDLVDATGKVLEREDGIYLHHMTLFTPVVKALDDVEGFFSGNDPSFNSFSHPIYLIGEERFPLSYPKAGVYVKKGHTALLNAMVQNRAEVPRDVYLQMSYEYLPGKPEGYVDIISVSQNALGFMVTAPKGLEKFTRTSSTYTSPYDARILMMYGHLHDGGTHTEMMVNGKVTCNSTAYYADMQPPTGPLFETGHSHSRRESVARRDGPTPTKRVHITSFGQCNEVGLIKKGDKITTKVYYDFTKRPNDVNKDGSPADLMGISMTYLGIPLPKD